MNPPRLPPLQPGPRPITPATPDPTCPILLEARQVLEEAHDLNHHLSRLRRSTQRCQTCPQKSTCPSVLYLAQAVDTAIRQLRREWGLDRE